MARMSTKNAWSRYIDATSGGDANSVIARKVGADPATIGRWKTGAVDPKPRQVVDYARAYGQSPIAALITAGYVDADELDLDIVPMPPSLHDFPDIVLAEELLRRIRERAAAGEEVGPEVALVTGSLRVIGDQARD